MFSSGRPAGAGRVAQAAGTSDLRGPKSLTCLLPQNIRHVLDLKKIKIEQHSNILKQS